MIDELRISETPRLVVALINECRAAVFEPVAVRRTGPNRHQNDGILKFMPAWRLKPSRGHMLIYEMMLSLIDVECLIPGDAYESYTVDNGPEHRRSPIS